MERVALGSPGPATNVALQRLPNPPEQWIATDRGNFRVPLDAELTVRELELVDALVNVFTSLPATTIEETESE